MLNETGLCGDRMYGINGSRFRMVTVRVKWNDCNELDDLLWQCDHLYMIPDIDGMYCRGFLSPKDRDWLDIFLSMTPYGNAYEVYDEEFMRYDEHKELMRRIKPNKNNCSIWKR